MVLLRKALQLSAAERRLLAETAFLLEAVKLGMKLLPFRMLRRLLARVADVPKNPSRGRSHPPAEKIAWAVKAASQHTPGIKTCLAQALVAQVLLARRGHPALLHIGVARGERGQFQAHAWVETEGGTALVGVPEPGRYTTLTTLKVRRPEESPVKDS